MHQQARPRTGAVVNPHVLIPLEEVIARAAISKTVIYKQIRQGTFPRPVPVGERRRAWVETEIEAWIAARIAVRDATASADA